MARKSNCLVAVAKCPKCIKNAIVMGVLPGELCERCGSKMIDLTPQEHEFILKSREEFSEELLNR